MNRNAFSFSIPLLALVLALSACRQESPAATAAAPSTPTAVATAREADVPAPAAIQIPTGTYVLDPTHTMVLAQWNHMGFSNPTLNFGDAKGSVEWNAEDPTASRVDVVLPLTGLNAFSPDFEKHLASSDFFDEAKFPEARFKSTQVTPAGTNRYTVVGDLTLKGVTKPVTLTVTVNGAGTHPMTQLPSVGFDATGTILRSDFGLGMYAPAVSDEVNLRITTEASQAAPAPATGTEAK